MEISRQADYAIRTIIDLARISGDELAQTREIAHRQSIPEKYLPTIIRTLARAGILRTVRGSRGGVTLSRPPSHITMREVVEAIDGPVLLNRCLIRPGECGGDGRDCLCSMHSFWDRMVREIQAEMESVNFGDLVTEAIANELSTDR